MTPQETTKIQVYKRLKHGLKLVDYIPKPVKETTEEEIEQIVLNDQDRERIRLRLKIAFLEHLYNPKLPVKRNYSLQQIANKLEYGQIKDRERDIEVGFKHT